MSCKNIYWPCHVQGPTAPAVVGATELAKGCKQVEIFFKVFKKFPSKMTQCYTTEIK